MMVSTFYETEISCGELPDPLHIHCQYLKDGPITLSIQIKWYFIPTRRLITCMTTCITAAKMVTHVYSNISFPQDSAFLDAAVREREEELSRRTLQALLDMRIKFPGKTDEEAEVILESVSVGHFADMFRTCFSSFGKFRSLFSRKSYRIPHCCSFIFFLAVSFRFKITGSFINQEWLRIGWWSLTR